MPVSPVTNGSVILDTDVEAMHESVRVVVNAMTKSRLERGAFNASQLPGVVVGGDFLEVGSETVNTSPAAFSEATASIAVWQDLAGYRLAGAALPQCTLLLFAGATLDSFAAEPNFDGQLWMNLYFRYDGVDILEKLWNRVVWGSAAAGNNAATHEHFAWFHVRERSAGTLNYLGMRAALNRGSTAGPVPDATLSHGYIGWLALYRES